MLMEWIVLGALGLVATGCLALALVQWRRAASLDEALSATRSQLGMTTSQLEAARAMAGELDRARGQADTLGKKLEDAYTEDRQKVSWLDHQQQEIDWLRTELEKRPKVNRKTYKILTLGMKGTGKTSLTLKWANPLTDLGALQGTKIERYERTVSHVTVKDVVTEHVFEVGDWGGEHIVDAQQELVVEEIHGLLIVVDLSAPDATNFDPARVDEQLREFQSQALKYFFSPKTVASCKAVVLFINKSDVLTGTPAEVERLARHHYRRLVEDLERYRSQVDIRVFVGSATYGHNVHHLFSHFVERILPKNAYDPQLFQRMKQDAAMVNMPRSAGLLPLPHAASASVATAPLAPQGGAHGR